MNAHLVAVCLFAAALHFSRAQLLSQLGIPQTSQPTNNNYPQQQQAQQQPQQQPQQQQQQPQQFLPQLAQAAQAVIQQAQVPPFGLPQYDVINRCRQSTFATDADVLTVLQTQSIPYTSSGQCLLACSAQQLGLVNAGLPFEIQGAGVLMRTLYPARGNDYLFQNELMNAVNSCSSNLASQVAGIQLAQAGLQVLNSFTQQGRGR